MTSSDDNRGVPSRETIARRAHEIWERAGRPEGMAKLHWRQAEDELRGEQAETHNPDMPVSSKQVAARRGSTADPVVVREQRAQQAGVTPPVRPAKSDGTPPPTRKGHG